MDLGLLWNVVIMKPMINVLLWMYGLLQGNFVIALILFTALTRLITWPLTAQQTKSSTAMQEVGPKIKKLQEKYKDNPEELSRKTWEVYKEHGVSPVSGCLPLIIQLPLLFGLYQALRSSLAAGPLELLTLAQHLYPHQDLASFLQWLPNVATLLPVNNHYGWLDLSKPDIYFILPVLVVITTFLQNKLLTPPNPDPQQAAMNSTMQLMMPAMIGMFSLQFPSGLSLYWIVTNLIGIGQYAAMGRANINNVLGRDADGNFSWRAFIGIPAAPEEPKKRGARNTKKK